MTVALHDFAKSMQKRNVLSSPRLLELKKQRRKVVVNKILISFFCFLVVFISLVFLSRRPSLNIRDIEISGNNIVDTEMIRSLVNEGIAGKYLWLFPKTNIVIYPKNTIKLALQNKFKRLKDINFSIKDNKTLSLSVTEREALYTWCGVKTPEITDTAPTNSADQKCYFIDTDGYVFDEAPYFSGDVYFKFYGATDGGEYISDEAFNPSGNYYSKLNFKQFVDFKDMLTGIKLKPVSLYIGDKNETTVFLSGGPKIMLNTDADLEHLTENLSAALNTDPFQSEFKNKYSSLMYIDLRFGNKVYYKFR